MTMQPDGVLERLTARVESGFSEATAGLAALREEMIAGFAETHRKQNETNGNVTTLRLWRERVEGRLQGAAAALSPIGAVVKGTLLLGVGAVLAVVVPKVLG